MKLLALKPRFTIRAMLVAMAVLALFLWYHLNWIHQRDRVSVAKAVLRVPTDRILYLEASPAIDQQADEKFPLGLRLLGERPRPLLYLNWDNDETWPEEEERLKGLFPETNIIRSRKVEFVPTVTP